MSKLKICGVKSLDEAKELIDCGVDLAGLNFVPTSTRFISLGTAREIMVELKSAGIQTVALFAIRPLEEVNDYVAQLGVDYVQLHGNEPADYARAVNAKVIRAVGVGPGQAAAEIIKFMKDYPADYFVLDRLKQGQGDLIDAELAAEVVSALPDRIFLAGGLTPDNLADVLAKVRPYGIDIAGGARDAHDDLDVAKVRGCQEIVYNHNHAQY